MLQTQPFRPAVSLSPPQGRPVRGRPLRRRLVRRQRRPAAVAGGGRPQADQVHGGHHTRPELPVVVSQHTHTHARRRRQRSRARIFFHFYRRQGFSHATFPSDLTPVCFLRLVWIFRPLGDSVRLIFAQIKSFLTKAVDRKDQRFHSWDSVTSAANNN